ncbi:chromosome segregation ATPase [Desulfuromonas versatilis]|uniref:Chromosome segregation ATPase n=1 Tax=Desulfuromonas versatilis TaxID=2802975 RepID=A0ABN6DXR3_9BACT|nr:DUF4398 domain-containing protein [Desulfuromonas versatilis]BCR04009.1 chromosome segregation ATPase [Desulfuromonas versatilis]
MLMEKANPNYEGRTGMKWTNHLSALLTIGGLALAGCAGTPPPNEQIRVTKAAIVGAESAGAHQFAPLEFRSAEEKIKQAEAAMQKEDYDKARRLAEQAEVDARLAEARSRRVKTEKAAQELNQSIETLQREIERRSSP